VQVTPDPARANVNCFDCRALVDCPGHLVVALAFVRSAVSVTRFRRIAQKNGARCASLVQGERATISFPDLSQTYGLPESVQDKVVAICASRCITPTVDHVRLKWHLFCFANDVTDVAGGRRRFSAEEAS
jgi:hypothetical protein